MRYIFGVNKTSDINVLYSVCDTNLYLIMRHVFGDINAYDTNISFIQLALSCISCCYYSITSSDTPTTGQHCGHLCLRPEHLHAEINLMAESQKQLARECAQLSFNRSSTAALINIRDGLGMEKINWKDSQIDNLRKVESQEFSDLSAEASSADKLVATFEKRDDVNFLYVTYRKDEGMMMMTQKERKQVKDIRNGVDLKDETVELDKLYEANRLSGDSYI
jgi:hypothetical protein